MTDNVELTTKPGRYGQHHGRIRLHATSKVPAHLLIETKVESHYWNERKISGKWMRNSYADPKEMNNKITDEYNKVKDTV